LTEDKRAELCEMASGVMAVVTKVASRRLVLAMEVIHEMEIEPLRKALRKLIVAARTSGGVAGRDDGLCAACDEAERVLTTGQTAGKRE
jgi:hypothetical protein